MAVFNSDEASWHLVEDHRGKTVYDVASGDALFISELGPLPGKRYLVVAGRGISEVERHSLGEGYGSRKTVPDTGGGRDKKQPDVGSE
ncbi:tail fiber assembly protein [Escherichia coli TA447]|uniref:Tail fiber assembly protein n=1 Tax=Escherichia coli TA447 TaxID=656447 RepID=A0A1X3J184_ECOLX|nr:tail fiber assembly protein [Escherichia coli TA447]